MKKIIFSALLAVIFFQFFTFTPIISLARADGPADINTQEGFNNGEIQEAFGATSEPADPRVIVSNIIKVILTLLAIIFIVLLVYAGFTWMTSGGEEEKVNKAKDTIVRAVIGLVIILSAYGVTIFVTKSIINSTKTNLYQ
jgi:hypothetical protein